MVDFYKSIQLKVKNNILYIVFCLFVLASLTSIKCFPGPSTVIGILYRTAVATLSIFCSSILIPVLDFKHRRYIFVLLIAAVLFFVISFFTGIIWIDETNHIKTLVAFDNLGRNIALVTLLVSYYFCFSRITKRATLFFLLGTIAYAFFASILGLILDYNDFVNVLIDKEGQNFDFDSFFLTKNYFGIIISFGLISLSMIPRFFPKNKVLFYSADIVISLFLFFVLIVTRAKTSIFLIIIFYSVFLFFVSKNKKKLLLYFIVLFSLILIFVLWYFVPPIYSLFSFSNKFHHFLQHTLIEDSAVVFKSRFENWLSFFSNFSWKTTLGVGDRSFYYLLKQDIHITSLDNAYLTFLGQGGIFKIAIFIITIQVILFCVKKERVYYSETLLLFIVFLGYGLFLDFSFNSLSFESYAFVGLIAVCNKNPIQTNP